MAEPSVDFFLHMNEASLKTPLELFKKNLKDINRINEKQQATIDSQLKAIDRSETLESKLADLKSLISNLDTYQNKLEEKIVLENNYNNTLEKRIEKFRQLNELKIGNTGYEASANKNNFLAKQFGDGYVNSDLTSLDNNSQLSDWFKDQVDVLIAQYLLKITNFDDLPSTFLKTTIDFQDLDKNSEDISNYIKSKPALLYLHNFDNSALVDYELIIRSNLITRDVLVNRTSKDLLGTWIKENEKFLKKNQSSLKFEYFLTTFIELIKDNVLKSENLIDMTNFSHNSSNESNYLDALIFIKNELFQINREEHNKYLDKIQAAMGLLAIPNAVILLFIKYERFLIKNFYRKKYCLGNLSSVVYSKNQYLHFKILIKKDMFLWFLNQLPVSKSHKLTFKKYLLNRNLFQYFKLLSFKRFNYLNSLFIDDYNQLYNFSASSSSFEKLLSLGLSVLKTRNCMTPSDLKKVSHLSNFQTLNLNIDCHNHQNIDQKKSSNSNQKLRERLVKLKSKHCTICSSIQLIKLSSHLVFSHHSKSKLSYKTPVLLPNNNIYDMEELFKFNNALLISFKNHIESGNTCSLDFIDDYEGLYNNFKKFLNDNGDYDDAFLQKYDKIADPLTGEFFNSSQCQVKVFPT
ncbi:glucose-induced degradation complex subunit [Saccharomycopsis crataegensis]|uniref:Glucose-induced degradation complex subunit n=1 Tax=Saccharomycopsis crataegensis TaxID=43959 RepID=A0AAV5QNX8_9ASCO|nr:glucose-induced degradation complex subunit [Saccharomycopsis crataegensis]